MPFVHVRRGKHRGKYRSPSGRYFTRAQVRRYYARGGTFDAAPKSVDPTGTGRVRRDLATQLRRRWRVVENNIREAMSAERDLFGLRTGITTTSPPEQRLRAFQSWFDAILAQHVIGDEEWLRQTLSRGYAIGVERARRQIAGTSTLPEFGPSLGLATAAARVELQGVAEAVSQMAVRAVAEALIGGLPPVQAIRDALRRGETRTNALANFTVVRAHALGTLDTLRAAGHRLVGIEPEYHVHHHVGDAKIPPVTRRLIRRARRAKGKLERAFRRGQAVEVRTAGDAKVCPVCEEIAESGPYHIDDAQALIPAHPNCRCAFVPATTMDYDPSQKRAPKGESIGGQWIKQGSSSVGRTLIMIAELHEESVGPPPMTDEEGRALVRYTGDDYEDINEWLRSGGRKHNSYAEEQVARLDDVMKRTKLSEDLRVYRRFGPNTQKRIEGLRDGETFQDKAFVSTTMSKSLHSGDRLVEIRIPRGYAALPVGSLSVHEHEQEILLRRDTKFRVGRDGGSVYLEVVP